MNLIEMKRQANGNHIRDSFRAFLKHSLNWYLSSRRLVSELVDSAQLLSSVTTLFLFRAPTSFGTQDTDVSDVSTSNSSASDHSLAFLWISSLFFWHCFVMNVIGWRLTRDLRVLRLAVGSVAMGHDWPLWAWSRSLPGKRSFRADSKFWAIGGPSGVGWKWCVGSQVHSLWCHPYHFVKYCVRPLVSTLLANMSSTV